MEQVAASIPTELETSVIAEQKLGKQFPILLKMD
jgi:hypothetical protein